ncbi:MAG: hypothetical protein JKY48_03805 [Flavobacteriales bacterium]|nr:hypothetical protein [Flavobacteriales bacterium]
MKRSFIKKNSNFIFALVVYLIYVLGYIFPEKLWGVHFSAFLSNEIAFVVLLLPLLLIIGVRFFENKLKLNSLQLNKRIWNYFVLFTPLIAALLFYHFPIPDDFYGNARNYYFVKNTVVSQLPNDFFDKLFSLNITPGQGRNGVKLIVDLISFYFKVSLQQSFIILNTFCGGLYVLLLLKVISVHLQAVKNRFILSLAFLSSPMFLIYFGHIETYAPVFLLLLAWLSIYVRLFRSRKKTLLIPLLLILLLGVRFHTLFILLVPACLLLTVHLFYPQVVDKISRPRKIFTYIYIPLVFFGLLAYFFIFKDYNDPRKLSNFEDIERLFLPMLSPPEPLDKCNLFSVNHFLDFVNIILLWSPIFLFLFLSIIRLKKSAIKYSFEVSSLLLTLAIYVSFLFAINPLLSMPMDWDLFMFPVTILFVLVLLLLQPLQEKFFSTRRTILLLSISSLCLPAFFCFLSAKPNSSRIESIGKHIYKSYYEHASTYLLYAINGSSTKAEYIQRLNQCIKQLKPYSIPGKDKQYSDLLYDLSFTRYYTENNTIKARSYFLEAMAYFPDELKFHSHITQINKELLQTNFEFTGQDKKASDSLLQKGNESLKAKADTSLAMDYLQQAIFYYPKNHTALIKSMELYFLSKQYSKAYDQALLLEKLHHSNPTKILKILIHTALEAELYEKAFQHSKTLLKAEPESELGLKLIERLNQNKKLSELKFLFRQK